MRLAWICAALLVACAARTAGPPPESTHAARLQLPPSGLGAAEKARHLLDRLAFGPRPAELEALTREGDGGLGAWLERELLGPTRDPALEAKLGALATYGLPVSRVQASGAGAERVYGELAAAKLVAAIEARDQLAEVLARFWSGYFPVDASGEGAFTAAAYEREAIRPHLFGRFRDLLEAVSMHPAMLHSSGAWLSIRDDPMPGGGLRRRHPPGPTGRGLDPRRARALLEAETVGPGEFSERDVRDAARCLTGWTLADPQRDARAVFREAEHDPREKTVLGTVVPAGGGAGDLAALVDLLSSRPVTARHVAASLAARFVSPDPPPALVERLAKEFAASDGDLRQVYEALFTSAEFWSPLAYRRQTKTPFEMVVSAVRILDGHVTHAGFLAQELARLGEPIWRCPQPAGCASTASSEPRLRFALRLAGNGIPGVQVTLPDLARHNWLEEPQVTLDRAAGLLLAGELSDATRDTVMAELSPEARRGPDGRIRPMDRAEVVGILLASREFQRR